MYQLQRPLAQLSVLELLRASTCQVCTWSSREQGRARRRTPQVSRPGQGVCAARLLRLWPRAGNVTSLGPRTAPPSAAVRVERTVAGSAGRRGPSVGAIAGDAKRGHSDFQDALCLSS